MKYFFYKFLETASYQLSTRLFLRHVLLPLSLDSRLCFYRISNKDFFIIQVVNQAILS